MDFAPPTTFFGKIFVILFRKIENMDDALAGRYKIYLEQAGFKNIQPIYRLFGMIELLKATK